MVDSFFDSLPQYLELLMKYLPIVITIAIPVAIFIAYQKTQYETNKAKETAGMLGLNYINVAEEMKQNKKEDSVLLDFLSGWSTWAMEGTYNAVPVRVELIVKSKQQSYIPNSDSVSVSNPTRTSYSRGTAYVAYFAKPLPFDVSIWQNIKLPAGFPPIQSTDKIETGDKELDQMLFIKGNDKNNIQEWLNANGRKQALKEIFQALPSITINNDGLRMRDVSKKAEYNHLKNNLTLLSKAVLRLQVD